MRIRDFISDAFGRRGPKLKPRFQARSLFCVAVFAAIPYAAGISQSSLAGGPGHDYGVLPSNPTSNPTADANRIIEDSMRLRESQKRIAALNVQRQKDMTLDTEKLVLLAIKLKAETDRTSKDKLSVTELRQAELIEKLAKSVGNKMRASDGN
jgi:hypothetical protein